MKKPAVLWVSSAKRHIQLSNVYITLSNTRQTLAMSMIRSKLLLESKRKEWKKRWLMKGEENLRSAKGVKSALFITTILKKGILTRASPLAHLHLHNLFLTHSLNKKISLTKVWTKEASWCIKVKTCLIISDPIALSKICSIIIYLSESFQPQVKMEVVGAEMLQSTKWWCKEIYRCFSNSSKYCFPNSSRLYSRNN